MTIPVIPMADPGSCRCACEAASHDPGRRQALAGALAVLLPGAAFGQSASGTRKPEPGDRLVLQSDEQKAQPLKASDLVIGAAPTLAYPLDAASGKPLASRANILTLARFKPDAFKATSAKNAADGVVAFSALCTHAGCPVTQLHPGQTQLVCNCHGSVFDACDRGTVTNGPATRRLAMLPLTVKDGVLTIAGRFDGPLGPPT